MGGVNALPHTDDVLSEVHVMGAERESLTNAQVEHSRNSRVTQRPYTGCKDLVDFGVPSVSTQGPLTSRPYFGARSMSRAMLSALGGPDGPAQLTTGSAISAQKFSNPAGVKMTNPFPGPAPMFWYVWTVPLGTRKKEPGLASTVRLPSRNENLPSIM
jgi:hypothetical protein